MMWNDWSNPYSRLWEIGFPVAIIALMVLVGYLMASSPR